MRCIFSRDIVLQCLDDKDESIRLRALDLIVGMVRNVYHLIHLATFASLHYITLHYITLHYITLHYITLHYITLHYITLHYITLHYITLHYVGNVAKRHLNSSPIDKLGNWCPKGWPGA